MTGDSRRPSGPDSSDLAWCHDAVQDVSRTFALTVEVLEEPMATRICLGYLLCRIPDTIEDAGHVPEEETAALLGTYGRALDPDDDTQMERFVSEAAAWQPAAGDRSADWRVVSESARVHAAFQTLPAGVRGEVVPPVLELVAGMARFADRYADEGGIRIRSRAELELYCHYAAGTVGNLITNLLTRSDLSPAQRRTLRDTAEAFGLLLQLVNVAKDVYADFTEENNRYLPASWLREAGVPAGHLLDPTYRDEAAGVVERTAACARSYLDDAQRYLTAMPLQEGNTLAAWAVPFLLAVGTLRELSERPADALRDREVKVQRAEVHAVLEAIQGADPGTVADLRASVEAGPLHRAGGESVSVD